MEQLSNFVSRKSQPIRLVDRKAPALEWKKPDSGNFKNDPVYRRINLRMGRDPGELRNLWKMVDT